MKLSTARLCLDCEAIHEEHSCPSCGSAAFLLLSKVLDSVIDRDFEKNFTREAKCYAEFLSRSSGALFV